MAHEHDINYDDERLAQVEADKSAALSEAENTYDGMIDNAEKHYQDQINVSKEWADKQSQLQQEKTDFAIDQIEQQKAQVQKDYTKEQSSAYADWQKQSNKYGVNAEQQAAAGMTGTGYSESSQVSMYNTYQKRVAMARESYNNAVLNYNNAIKDARLQNNAALAEIAYQALQQQLELSLEGFQYKNQLVLDKASKKTGLESMYYGRYQDVLQQINTENALAEEIRQFNEQMAWEKEQWNAKNPKTTGGTPSVTPGNTFIDKPGDTGEAETGEKDATEMAIASANKGNGKSGAAKVDLQSVADLGYGPISATRLSNLVDQGIVKQYTDGNKIKFKKVANRKSGTGGTI